MSSVKSMSSVKQQKSEKSIDSVKQEESKEKEPEIELPSKYWRDEKFDMF